MSKTVKSAAAAAKGKGLTENKNLSKKAASEAKAKADAEAHEQDEANVASADEEELHSSSMSEIFTSDLPLTDGFSFAGALADAAAGSSSVIANFAQASDAGGSDGGSYDDGGGVSPLLLVGGLVLVGGGIALAAGGGGDDEPANNAPTVNASQTVTTNEDTSVSITVSASDPDGDTLTYTNTSPAKGTVTGSAGSYTFNPDGDFEGLDTGESENVTFTVTARDPGGLTAEQTVTVTVTGVNDAPVAAAATATATEDGPNVTGQLSATDVDGDNLTFSQNGPLLAGLTINGNGSYVFNPGNAAYQSLAEGETDDLVANYTVSDGDLTDTSTLTITITGKNDAPFDVGSTTQINVDEDDSATFIIDFDDVDNGAVLSVTVSDAPDHGTVQNIGGQNVYTPDPDYNGPDSFDISVTDGIATVTYTVNVTVNPQPELVSIDAGQIVPNVPAIFVVDDDEYVLLDDPTMPTNVVIQGFELDDTISVSPNPTGTYAFSNDFADPNDLRIEYNDQGAVNIILIDDVIPDNVAVVDQATAEAALGGSFITFG